ncbi:MAG: hypothetical protein GY777_13365 [Candidatus Brocadiaceae bacterium]|nr:hypothetical protein [Candidatus Brocadiaceae bacterium]
MRNTMRAGCHKRSMVLRVAILSILLYIMSLSARGAFAIEQGVEAEPKRNIVDYSPVQGFLRSLKLRREPLFEYTCNECHRVFSTKGSGKNRIAEHVDLKLNHGSNDNCMNCHHKVNRNAYVTNDGNEIPSNRPEILCSKCHGMVYRDWMIGVHGRISISWNSNSKGWHLLVCTECHDPHDPGFPQLVPMPGPSIPGENKGNGAH